MKTGITHICDAIDNGLYLRLIDGCFAIVKGSTIIAKMCCFNNLNSPIDGYEQKNIIISANSEEILFDNRINEYLLGIDKNLKAYMNRGIILWANYPDTDIDGLPVPDDELSLILRVTTVGKINSPEGDELEIETEDIPWYKFFTTIQNPITTDLNKLIDKIEIINPNNYEVNVNSLLVNVSKDGSSLDNVLVGC